MLLRPVTLVVFYSLIFFQTTSTVVGVQGNNPATVAEARQILDLSTFALIDHDGGPATQMVANQAYTAKGSAEQVATKIETILVDKGFSKAEGSMTTPAYCTATFSKNGFQFNLMVMPDSTEGLARVNLTNLGNVEMKKLPTPKDSTEVYSLAASRMLTSESSVETTRNRCRELLESDGWYWYGDTTVSFYMRKNGVRLQVMVSPAATPEAKTTILYSAEQLSTDIPLPDHLQMIQYSDANGGTIVDSNSLKEQFAAELRQAMKSKGWVATTEQAIVIDFHDHVVFRSPENELADCEYFESEGMTRCRIKYLNAVQVEAQNEAAGKKMNASKE